MMINHNLRNTEEIGHDLNYVTIPLFA